MDKKPHSSRSIMLITIGVAILLSLLVWPLSKLGKGDGNTLGGDEAELRVQPVARVEMRQAPVIRSDGKPRSGEAVYTAVCQTCHAAGLAGAPKIGDKAAWGPRIASGNAALLKSAINGKAGMPARGGGADLTDDEVKAAVEYIVGKSK